MTEAGRERDSGATAAAAEGSRRRWLTVGLNVLLVLAVAGLLLATWMPAIYDRMSTTRPAP